MDTAVTSPVAEAAPVAETAAVEAPAAVEVVAEPGTEQHFQKALDAALKEAGTVQEARDRENAAEADKTEPAAAVKAEPAKDEPKESPGSLAKIRRLYNEGKITEALEAAGIPIDKVEPTTKAWKAVKRQVLEARTEVATAKAEAASHVAQAKTALGQVMPFVEGAQAYLAGDFAKFLQLTTGDTPETFQRKLIAQLHETPGQSDPKLVQEIEKLKRERAEERAAMRAEQERLQAEHSQLRYQQAQQAWIADISTELKAVPQFEKVAVKPAFIQRVFAVQQQAYNPKTQTTIDTIEAAEMVWDDLYGDVVAPPAARAQAGSTQVPRANGNNPAQAATTTLRHTQPTEAAPDLNGPWTPETQEKILERYTRMARSEQLARNL
jgi:hypothetical protein